MSEKQISSQMRRLGWSQYNEIVPPFNGVSLQEYQDRIELTPDYWCREFVALGKYDADEVGPRRKGQLHPIFKAAMGGSKIWVIATWRRYQDGREEALNLHYLDRNATEAEARNAFDDANRFLAMSREELLALSGCFKASPDEVAYAESRPSEKLGYGRSIDERDLYKARLIVLAGLQPKTVELINRADCEESVEKRQAIEREAVQAYFADLAHYWTPETITAWQSSNPVAKEWMAHFAQVLTSPKRALDKINHELALNWLREKYNLLTAEELAGAIRSATREEIAPATLKKRRERLGLTTKRPPGPRPNSER